MFLLAVSVPLLLLAALLKQQRLTAAALAESRRQYRSIVEDQTEMICRFRPDGSYSFANRAYAETFGLAPEQIANGNIWTLVPAWRPPQPFGAGGDHRSGPHRHPRGRRPDARGRAALAAVA